MHRRQNTLRNHLGCVFSPGGAWTFTMPPATLAAEGRSQSAAAQAAHRQHTLRCEGGNNVACQPTACTASPHTSSAQGNSQTSHRGIPSCTHCQDTRHRMPSSSCRNSHEHTAHQTILHSDSTGWTVQDPKGCITSLPARLSSAKLLLRTAAGC